MQVGFIGLGRMGLPMAQNLVEAGHEVTGFDIDDDQMSALESTGGESTTSTTGAVESADVVITVLRTPEQVSAVADEILPAMADGALYVDMSSIDPHTAEDVADRAAENNVRAVDAPVSGGVVGAEAGSLTIMIGGDEDDVADAQPLFEVMGEDIFYIGENGAGQTMKLCSQMMVGGQSVLLAETFHFGEAAGLDPQVLHDVLLQAAGRVGLLEIKGQKLVDKEFEPGFDVDLQTKDLRLALEAAEKFDVPAYAVASVFQTFIEAQSAGLGDRDQLSVYELRNH